MLRIAEIIRRLCLAACLSLCAALPVLAQSDPLIFATVERPPFAYFEDRELTGFSIDLIQILAREIGAEVEFVVKSEFSDMLGAVETAAVDGAIANISITGARELVMDFSLPIFGSGLQIMLPSDAERPSILWSLLNRQLGLALLAILGVLLSLGMLMWFFERGKQSYFDRSPSQAVFPAFWYALSLMVRGGFGQTVPGSVVGRVIGVVMVISGLFLVAFVVASLTTQMTLRALEEQVDSINDLEGRVVATTEGSTASEFLTDRDIAHVTFVDFTALLWAFEDGELDAIFFDGPLLAYYASNEGRGRARLVERVFRPEDYGIALPQGSELRERLNVALLNVQETGEYDDLYFRWFEQGSAEP